jgi:hypothetical protein
MSRMTMAARVGLVLLVVGVVAAGVAWSRASAADAANATRRNQIQLADSDGAVYAASWPPADAGMWQGYTLLFSAVAAAGAGIMLLGRPSS